MSSSDRDPAFERASAHHYATWRHAWRLGPWAKLQY